MRKQAQNLLLRISDSNKFSWPFCSVWKPRVTAVVVAQPVHRQFQCSWLRFRVLTFVHGRFPEFTFTIPEQCKIYESSAILFSGELGFFKGKTACPLSPFVVETIVYQGQPATRISMESDIIISQQLEAVDENHTLQQRHKLQVEELVILCPSSVRHSRMADAEAAMHCKHGRRTYLSMGQLGPKGPQHMTFQKQILGCLLLLKEWQCHCCIHTGDAVVSTVGNSVFCQNIEAGMVISSLSS
jgi:hypothetical protein